MPLTGSKYAKYGDGTLWNNYATIQNSEADCESTKACEPNVTHHLFLYSSAQAENFYIFKWWGKKEYVVTHES